MNGYELVSFIWLIVSSIMLIYMANKTENLEDKMTNLDYYINATLYPQIKTIRQLVSDEIINKKEDNGCSMQKCPINALTFESCDLSENECKYYTGNDTGDYVYIKDALTNLLGDGYNIPMIETVLEQIKMDAASEIVKSYKEKED